MKEGENGWIKMRKFALWIIIIYAQQSHTKNYNNYSDIIASTFWIRRDMNTRIEHSLIYQNAGVVNVRLSHSLLCSFKNDNAASFIHFLTINLKNLKNLTGVRHFPAAWSTSLLSACILLILSFKTTFGIKIISKHYLSFLSFQVW